MIRENLRTKTYTHARLINVLYSSKGTISCKKKKAKCTIECHNNKMVGSMSAGGKKSCTCVEVNGGWDCQTGSSGTGIIVICCDLFI